MAKSVYALEQLKFILGNAVKAMFKSTGLIMSAALQTAKGADVASASVITLGKAGNAFQITGTTTINHIVKTDWQVGAKVVLLFGSSLTVTHNAGSVPADAAAVLLAGAVNLAATANDSLTLLFDGIQWREIARTVI